MKYLACLVMALCAAAFTLITLAYARAYIVSDSLAKYGKITGNDPHIDYAMVAALSGAFAIIVAVVVSAEVVSWLRK
jgi:hypothetical protein